MSGRKRVRRSQKKNPTEVAKLTDKTESKSVASEKANEVVKIVTSGESFEVGKAAEESSRSSSIRSTKGLNLKPSGEKSEVEPKKSTSLKHTSITFSKG